MTWTAIVPIKPAASRKTRLGLLDPAARLALTDHMLDHVLAVLRGHGAIGRVMLLATQPRHGSCWIVDRGRGLNAELQGARADIGDMLIVHADLPFLGADDITAMLDATDRHQVAVAPDHNGTGTNALALRAIVHFALHFGPDSRRRHLEQPGHRPAIVDRPGLAFDIDTYRDLRLAQARGFPHFGDLD